MRRKASDSRTATLIPSARSCLSTSAANVDFPDAGRPVIQTANADSLLRSTVVIDLVRIEQVLAENGVHKVEKLTAYRFRQIGIPDRVRHHQTAEHRETRSDLQYFRIAGLLEVTVPKAPEQRFEIAVKTTGALQRKEEIVHREARDIVCRFSPFAA